MRRAGIERLSAREMEVLKLVVEGNTSVQLATQLGLSPKSIDTYRSRLRSRRGLDDRPDAAQQAAASARLLDILLEGLRSRPA